MLKNIIIVWTNSTISRSRHNKKKLNKYQKRISRKKSVIFQQQFLCYVYCIHNVKQQGWQFQFCYSINSTMWNISSLMLILTFWIIIIFCSKKAYLSCKTQHNKQNENMLNCTLAMHIGIGVCLFHEHHVPRPLYET